MYSTKAMLYECCNHSGNANSRALSLFPTVVDPQRLLPRKKAAHVVPSSGTRAGAAELAQISHPCVRLSTCNQAEHSSELEL